MMAALVFAASFAATPQLAAVQAVRPPGMTSLAVVVRSNVAGRYAVVTVRGGSIEGQPVDQPILLERFWFGWQPLDMVGPQICLLSDRGIPASSVEVLVRGLPPSVGDLACRLPPVIDAGSPADVAYLRARMRGPFVPYVIVSGDYGMGEWYGSGGGETFFKRTGSGWTRIAYGGGALGTRDLQRMGMPMSVICAFHTYDAACPK